MVGYADDFVVLGRTEVAAQEALEVVRNWTLTGGLTLHPVKTRIVDALQVGGFDFLGYHFERGDRWPRMKTSASSRTRFELRPGVTTGRACRPSSPT